MGYLNYIFCEVLCLDTRRCIVDGHRGLGLQPVQPRIFNLELDEFGERRLGVDKPAADAEKNLIFNVGNLLVF